MVMVCMYATHTYASYKCTLSRIQACHNNNEIYARFLDENPKAKPQLGIYMKPKVLLYVCIIVYKAMYNNLTSFF